VPITLTNKTANETEIPAGGSFEVTLTISGEPNIAQIPTDIILILDRSGSMGIDNRLEELKSSSNLFVDMIEEATTGSLDGYIGGGSRMGVVSFSEEAILEQPLTDNATDVKTAINNITLDGGTYHAPGFITAQTELASSNPLSKKIMIMFTDGAGSDTVVANIAATDAKAQGTEIFAIGIGGAEESALIDWVSEPKEDHVFTADTTEALDAIFAEIAEIISEPAGTNIEIVDRVNSEFSVTNINVDKGTAEIIGNDIIWRIDSLGAIGPETATLTYLATHNLEGATGVMLINDFVDFTDDQGSIVTFPQPEIKVIPLPSRGINICFNCLNNYVN
jgi:uncharacterized protein YegL